MDRVSRGTEPFVICGKRSVLEALSSQRAYAIRRLLISARLEDELVKRIIGKAKQRQVVIEDTDLKELEMLAGPLMSSQGVALVLSEPPPEVTLESHIKAAAGRQSDLILALDEVADHQNIGAMVRAAVCFGVKLIIAPKDRSAPLVHPAVWRVSQGACEHVDFATVNNLGQAIRQIKEANWWVAGADAGASSVDVTGVKDLPKKLCLVMGSEDVGLRRLTRELCDFLWRIPHVTPGGLDSLNVSYAAAILLWEIGRKPPNKQGG
ncbi:MAG: 23S rRNA (guanosine(2251)-2'-O)-methyltransferase RlmB [Elusimicrobiota bacterium]